MNKEQIKENIINFLIGNTTCSEEIKEIEKMREEELQIIEDEKDYFVVKLGNYEETIEK